VLGDTVDSEVSGNMIDLCPVGALTSKPFRYTARTWELSRRKSVSPHDSTGSNLIVQVKGSRVMRVLPLDNEEVNECWIADRDRFSYEALGSAARLTQPMIRQGGEWQTVDWAVALEYVATGLRHIGAEHGASSIGAVASAASTVEELHLLARLVRGLGSANIDHRTRHADPANTVRAADGRPAARWLGTSIASLSQLERALVVGSFLRKDHPLFALRLRHAARHGCKVHSLHALRDDWLMPMAESLAVAPSGWVEALAEVAAVVAEARGVAAPRPAQPGEAARAIAASLGEGERKAVLLGQAAAQHPQAGTLLELANWIGEHTGASVGYLGEAANSLGAQLVDALPGEGGLDAGRMLGAEAPLKACLLLNVDPALEVADGPTAVAALHSAEMVVALTTFHGPVSDVADVLLPIAPFTETSGTFVNAEGRVQSFHGAVKPLGETRPGWKVLRVLGNLLELDGFDFESSEEVREAALGDREALAARLDNRGVPSAAAAPVAGLERIADVPIYMSDAMVRNAPSLQQTADARPPQAGLSRELWNRLGFAEGDRVRIVQGNGSVELPARLDPTLAANAVRVAAGHPDTAALGPMFGTLQVERVAARQPMAATEDVRG
jgi:NADH-quinone oxidoreductase subunit G